VLSKHFELDCYREREFRNHEDSAL
jgi:hypothetical protein